MMRWSSKARMSDWSKLCQPRVLPASMISLETAVLAFAVEERLAGAQATAHDLGHEKPAAVNFVHQALAHDVAQSVG